MLSARAFFFSIIFSITRLMAVTPWLVTSSTKSYKKYPLCFFFLICYVQYQEVEAGRILKNKGSLMCLPRRLKHAPAGKGRQGGEEFCYFFNPEIPLKKSNSDLEANRV